MKTLRCVGLDVHKDSIAVAVAEPEGGEPSLVGTIPNNTRLLLRQLRRLGKGAKLRCCYEAGSNGVWAAPRSERRWRAVHRGGALAGAEAGRLASEDRSSRCGEAG